VLLRFEGGAKGVLHASQISVGEENNLNIRVYGEVGGLEMASNEPNTLLLKWPDRPMEVYRTATVISAPPPKRHPQRRPHTRKVIWKLSPTSTRISPTTSGPSPRAGSWRRTTPPWTIPNRGRRARHGLHHRRRQILRRQRQMDQAWLTSAITEFIGIVKGSMELAYKV